MGLSMEFYAGDPQVIGTAFSEVETDEIRDGRQAVAYADLSLHVSPEDVDDLCRLIGEHLGVPLASLWDCLVTRVGLHDDGETGEAWTVEQRWVATVARLTDESAVPLVIRWIGAISDRLGEPLEVSRDAIDAVRSLVELCQKAQRARVGVVFVWYL